MRHSDRELIERIRAGRTDAFDELFARYRQTLLRHLTSMVRDEAAAEDLTQEVFLRLWTRAELWRGRGRVGAWLRRIATNLALNYVRAARRRRQQPLEVPSSVAGDQDRSRAADWMIDPDALDPAAVVEEAERYERLHRLIDGLTEEKRDVLRLVYESEMDISAAAEALAIPEGTVKSRLHFARKRLAREWEELEGKDR